MVRGTGCFGEEHDTNNDICKFCEDENECKRLDDEKEIIKEAKKLQMESEEVVEEAKKLMFFN